MTKTQDNILDELFEVKIGDNQTGYLWAKLSPKSKKRLKSLLKQAELRGNIEGAKEILSYRSYEIGEGAKPIIMPKGERRRFVDEFDIAGHINTWTTELEAEMENLS